MEDSTVMFDAELRLFGVDLEKVINSGTELVFNEFGVGGGASVVGDQPARTVLQAADYPFFGVYGPYTRKLDPWRTYLPGGLHTLYTQSPAALQIASISLH
jgi:hypothetical protein